MQSHHPKAAQCHHPPTDGSRAQGVKHPDPLPNTFPHVDPQHLKIQSVWLPEAASENEFSTCSYIFPKSSPELLNRFLHAPFNLRSLEGTYGIKEWFKGTAHWTQKCNFLLFTKFYSLSQAPLWVFLILVVILSFRSTSNANTIFFRH